MTGENVPQGAPEGFLEWLEAGRAAGWVSAHYCSRHEWPDEPGHLREALHLGLDPCLPSLLMTSAARCSRFEP